MHKLHSHNVTYGNSDASTNLATSGFSLFSPPVTHSYAHTTVPIMLKYVFTWQQSQPCQKKINMVKDNLANKKKKFILQLL